MKKILFAIPFLFCSCEMDTSKRNAKNYVEEQIDASLLLNTNDVKSIEVGNPDTVISSIVLSLDYNASCNAKQYYNDGKITYDSMMTVVAKFNSTIYDMSYALNVELNDKLRNKYENFLRSSYPVKVVMKSGITKDVSVVMDKDGITPIQFLHEIEEELESMKLRSYSF